MTTEWGSCTAADPYARAAGVNGERSMILDTARTDPPGWEHDRRPVIPAAKRSVWEINVRDFSQDPASGVRNAWRGKFLAFSQQGTTLNGDGIHPTCLNYLKRLGVSYVQLMPIFDFGSVDESRPLTRQYNWGYDPANFNVPEGSYSTDPARGEVRVRECKQMIQALHAAGIGVVMDVVYNHMYRADNVLNRVVPLYYFRQNEDGSLSNGSGCGNEFASERSMARRYMIDSVLYWAQEYHIDGFRFDLMGLYDVETMNLLRAELDKLPGGRDILMYGEPWQGGGSALHRYEANKNNLAMLNDRIGIFCDDTRDAIKGGCFNAREPGYVEGRPGSFWGYRRGGGGVVPQRQVPAPHTGADRELRFRPRQLHPVGQAADGAVRAPGVSCGGQGCAGPEPLGGGHLPHQHGAAFLAGGRGVCPHQKGAGQQLPLLPGAEPAGLEAGPAVPQPCGLLPGPHRAAGSLPPAGGSGQSQPQRH